MRPGHMAAIALLAGPVVGVLLLIIVPCNLGTNTPYLCGHNAGLGLLIAVPGGILLSGAAAFIIDSALWERRLTDNSSGSAVLRPLKGLLRLFSYLVAVFCLLGVFFAVLGMIDPQQAKLADDADPFGDPGTRWDAAKKLLVSLSGLFVSIGLAKRL